MVYAVVCLFVFRGGYIYNTILLCAHHDSFFEVHLLVFGVVGVVLGVGSSVKLSNTINLSDMHS